MKQPIWKRFLSYFFEIAIEASSTDLNPDLQLGLKKGRYCLSTPNAIYSYGDLYDNFTSSFHKIKIGESPIKDVLILGFGLGSIPFMLEKKFHKKCRYVGVEADEVIAYWAAKYLTNEMASPVQIVVADALLFVKTCQQKFDLIAMDIFLDSHIPEQFETPVFLKKLKSLLNNNGLLMFNRLSLLKEDREQSTAFFENTFLKIFPEGYCLDVGGNWMLIGENR